MENQDARTKENQDAAIGNPDLIIVEHIIAQPNNSTIGNPYLIIAELARKSAKPTKALVKSNKPSSKYAKPTAKHAKPPAKSHANPPAKPPVKPNKPPAKDKNPVKPVNPHFQPPSKVSLT